MGAIAESPAKVLRLSALMNLTERQREALAASESHRYVLYGGAAGGGKSRFLRWFLLRFLLRAYAVHGLRNVRVGLFCEDYTSLRDRQISKIKHEFPAELGEVRGTQDEGLTFKLREKLGGGFIAFRNLDDPKKYQSTEFAAMAVDELTKNPEVVFHELRTRLRWPGFPDGFRFPFVGATNPGGIGHAWVKRYWIDRDFPEHLPERDFAFVKSRAADNPYNPRTYYTDVLMTLPPELRKAYAEGDWDLFQGQFFGEWRHELHTCDPFEIPSWWERFTGTDWGYSNPFCTVWCAQDPDGNVFAYRELYERRRDAGWLGQEHVKRSVDSRGKPERVGLKVLDPACWDSSRGPSFAEQFAAAGWGCQKADNGRASGWMQVRRYLRWEKDATGVLTLAPRLKVFSTCRNLIRTLPALPFASGNAEDLDTGAEDHAADALRYALATRPRATVQPVEEMPPDLREAHLRLLHEARPATTASEWIA